MYRKNLPITTGKFPAKIKNFNSSANNFYFYQGTDFSIKGSRFSIAAFLLLITAFLSSACESPGIVGEDIISGEENVESQSYPIQDYSIIEDDSFSGRLSNTAIGYFQDPMYGTLTSVALLKPSIFATNVDTIKEEGTVSLRLIFNDPVYGDSLAVSNFEIYEANEIWRGTELRYNNTVDIDFTSKVADFRVEAEEDTVIVQLSEEWKNDFATYFNPDTTLSSSERDSIYINNFPGLAVVPSETNQNLRFLKTRASDDSDSNEDGEEFITSFLYSPVTQIGDETDASEQEIIDVRDWGASFTREMEPESHDQIVLHSSERVLKLQLGLPIEDLKTKNIVNARIVLSKDDSPSKNSPDIKRPNINAIRAHVFADEPNDVMDDIFTSEANFATSLDSTSNAFLMNVTPYVLNEVYGEQTNSSLYVSIERMNGVIYTSQFFDQNAADIKQPRLVITYVKD